MIKQISVLTLSNVIIALAQAIIFPYFASLAGSELMGEYGYLLSITQTFAIIVLFNTNLLIRICSENHLMNIFNSGMFMAFSSSLLYSIYLYLDFKFFICLLGFLLFNIHALHALGVSVIFREKRFKTIGILMIIRKLSVLAFLVVSTFYLNLNTVFACLVFAETVALFFVFHQAVKGGFKFKQVRLILDLSLFREQKDLITYKSLLDTLNRIGAQLPIIFLRNFANINLAGQYFFVQRMIQSPLQAISKSIREVVFVQRESLATLDSRRLDSLLIWTHLIVGTLILLILQLFQKELNVLIPLEWSGSLQMCYYIIPLLLSNSAASTFRDKLLLESNGSLLLKIDSLFFVFRLALFFMAYVFSFTMPNYFSGLVVITLIANCISMYSAWRPKIFSS